MNIEHSDKVPTSHVGHVAWLVLVALLGSVLGYAIGTDWQSAKNIEDNTAVSTSTKTKSTATTSATSASATATAGTSSTATNKLPKVTINKNLYQYGDVKTAGYTLGNRINNKTQSRSGLIGIANASDGDYPAIYRSFNNQIIETNIFTGVETVITTEGTGEYILDVAFNQIRQKLIYYVSATNKSGDLLIAKANVKIYDLNTQEKSTIYSLDNLIGEMSLGWSPDGTYATFGRGYNGDSASKKIELYYYSLSDGQVSQRILDSDSNSNTGSISSDYTWISDSSGILSVKMFFVKASDNSFHNQYHISLIGVKATEDKNFAENLFTDRYLGIAGKIGDKIIGSVQLACYASSNCSSADLQHKWLYIKDVKDNSLNDFQAEMKGDFVAKWVATKNADLAVYISEVPKTNTTIKKLDLTTGVRTDLKSPGASFRLLGWNGDEKNVLLMVTPGELYNLDVVNNELTRIQ